MKNILKLSPLLLLYIVVILFSANDILIDDEGDYLKFAVNLSHGYYSPAEDTDLWHGPGYPIVLLPIVLLKWPLLIAKLLNAIFLFLAIIYFFRALSYYMPERNALFFSYLLGVYPPFFRHIHQLMTETISVFLVCGFLFYLCVSYQGNNGTRKRLITASAFLGYLAMTKLIFGYTILTGIILCFCLYVWKKVQAVRKMLLVYLLAMLFCIPYLIYTYSLTGKIFYWGNSGGLSLYWMSSPVDEEFGDWIWEKRFEQHGDLFQKLEKVDPVEKDHEFKKLAMRNIINKPSKYFKNWLANIGRLVFNYPYSYTDQKISTYYYFLPNMFLVVVCILFVYPAYKFRKIIPSEIWHLILFGLIFIAGSSILSAYNRMLWPVVPIILFWIAYISNRFIKVEVK